MPTTRLNYTYIYFNTLDYTNTSVLSSYTLSNTPLKFVPDFTTSSILSGAQNISNKTLRWEFGDGTFSTDLSPSHIYQWPGEYNVSVTVYDGSGNAYDSTFTSTVKIYDFIATQISFEDYKSLIYDIPVGKLIDPLTVNTYFSWQSYQALSASGYTINLYASGARGAYDYVAKEQNDKWSHLRSLSRFYTLSTINGFSDYVTIESIQPAITPIYVNIQNNQLQLCNSTDNGSVLAGITGSCQFWYTDDKPGNLLTESSPIIIFASLDNAKFKDAFTQRTNAYNYISYPPYGYQNIDPAVFPSVKTRYNPANHLSITTTGIDGEGAPVDHTFDIPYISWQNTEVPYVIKFKDDQDFTTKNYPPLSSSIAVGSTIYGKPQSLCDVQTSVVYNDGTDNVPLEGVTFYEDFAPTAPQAIGAFYKGYFIPTQSTENCYLTASVNVIDPPYFRKDALVNWIAVPQYYSAIRLFREEIINGFTNTTTVAFPSNTFSIAGNNTYAITVAPSGATADSDYRTWFADSVNDQLFQYDIYGNLLTTYQLSAMTTLVNNQTSIVDYRYISTSTDDLTAASPNDIALDGKNNLWISLFDSGKVIKIDTSTGNVVTVATPSGTNTFLASSDYNSESGFAGENLYLPSSIDTDINNNLWVSYTHPEYSTLIQYQGENNFTISADILQTYTFPPGFSPEQIQIDRNSNVWVTAINHNSQGIGFSNRNDYLYKFDTSGNLVPGYPLSGFQQIGNLTIDGNQNAWVIQGAETLTKIDGVLGTTSNYVAGLGNNQTEYICSIGGLTCDTSNNIWVINNFDNSLYIIDANLPSTGVFNPKYTIPLEYPTPSLPPVTAYPVDTDAAAYIAQAGITDPFAAAQIYQFVAEVKQLGIWSNMICWPLISLQNVGTGSTVYALGGLSSSPNLFNATIKNNGSYTVNGIDLTYAGSPGGKVATDNNINLNYNNVFAYAVGRANTPGRQDLFASSDAGAGARNIWILPDGGGGAEFEFRESTKIISSNTSTDFNSWSTIGAVSGYTKAYKNASLIGTSTVSATNTYGGDNKITFGVYNDSNTGAYPGTVAFGMVYVSSSTIPESIVTSIDNLYKSTLGSNLPNFGIYPRNSLTAPSYTSTGLPGQPVNAPIPNTYSDGFQEFQAIGDWNGYSWLNKYAAPVSTIRTITGSSNLFNIYPDQGQFNIAKINENWNASGYYDSLRFQETLLDKQVFFDQFLGVILGGLNAQPYELGKTVYEKIANFVDNNADIDKTNINELLSFCRELSIEFDQYNVILPPQLRRLVDLLSIKHSKLWGIQNKYSLNLDPRGTIFPNDTYGINLGTIIDPLTGVFQNGVPIVAQEVFSGNYKIVNTNIINDNLVTYNTVYEMQVIPLSSYTPDWGWGLVAPDIVGLQISNYYTFYTYNPVYDNTYYDNIINWNDPYTTLQPTNSSYNSWSEDNGIIQSMLSYELTKGYNLFTSAANITYNS
jgi:PKD domain